jgi:hypothetical protein
MLESATCDIYPLVTRAAERLIADLEQHGTGGGRRYSDLHQLQDLIKTQYAASEHAPDVRKRLLDVIDAMLERELYGVDVIIKAHER